ncbi:E3 ubiquitin-protein ligase Praja-2, partial [Merops nubicus]
LFPPESLVAMGQEVSKFARTDPVEGNQTSGGYGRRHVSVCFRASMNNQDRDECSDNEDCERPEMGEVHGNSLGSSPLVQISPGLLDEPVLENIGTGEPICQVVSSQTLRVNTPLFSQLPHVLESNPISRNFMNPYENSEDLAGYASGGCNSLNGQHRTAFANFDSCEPDSKDKEEDDAQHKFPMAREEPDAFQQTLDNIHSEAKKHTQSFTGLESQFHAFNHSACREYCKEVEPVPLTRCFSMDSDLACPNRTFEYSTGFEAIQRSNLSGASYETEQIQNIVDVEIGAHASTANELDISGGRTDQGKSPEPVVRPKIRKQNIANQLERENLLDDEDDDGGESGSWRRTEIAEDQQGPTRCALQISKENKSSSIFFDLRECEDHQKHTELYLRRNAAAHEQNVSDDSTFWDAFQDCSRHFSDKDEDRSECSDGECCTPLPSYFTSSEDEQLSSDESWKTVQLGDEEEPDVQSSTSSTSSSSSEESTEEDALQEEEEASLEEGELPWFLYWEEEEESSSDEEEFLHGDLVPRAFILLAAVDPGDGSSASEDPDYEWRVLGEIGGNIPHQVVSGMDPQIVAVFAVEGHFQQAMEVALAQLEAIAFESDEAAPPATTEIIDALPHIVVTDDHDDEENCCTICCSEYEEGQIMTELPCHHFFHRLCVATWLQQSGTCPICRHVLARVRPEAAVA